MSNNRRVIHVTCSMHGGTPGYANLVVNKRDGHIVLDPHATGAQAPSRRSDHELRSPVGDLQHPRAAVRQDAVRPVRRIAVLRECRRRG